METVKAATLATARKLEKLAADQRKKGVTLNILIFIHVTLVEST